MVYIIRDRLTLERLERDNSLKRVVRSIKIETEADNGNWRSYEEKINRYYFACGCTSGQIAVFCTGAVLGILWLIDASPELFVWWKVVACVGAAALLGKVSGLAGSRYLLLRTYGQMEKLLV
jgi:hypothetical protein